MQVGVYGAISVENPWVYIERPTHSPGGRFTHVSFYFFFWPRISPKNNHFKELFKAIYAASEGKMAMRSNLITKSNLMTIT